MGRGTHRGFITYEELNKSLGKRNLSDENLSQAFIHILDENIALVEKKSDFKVLRKKEGSSKEEGKSMEKSDDPIRMYLREMGGVELLSREGEIAIAKRIEAGKDVMLIALSQSPMTAQQFFEWNDQLQNDEILVREIIDIDTNYMEDESTGPSAKQKNAGETEKLLPITEFGANAYTEEEEKSLSEIIDSFNERHGTSFSREDFLRFERVNRDIMDDDMKEMMRNNPADVVYTAFSQAFFQGMVRMFQNDREIQSIVLKDPAAREMATKHFFKRAQREAREF